MPTKHTQNDYRQLAAGEHADWVLIQTQLFHRRREKYACQYGDQRLQ